MSETGSHFVAGNVVNLYAAPDTASETISQAILGAAVQVVEVQNGLCRVTT